MFIMMITALRSQHLDAVVVTMADMVAIGGTASATLDRAHEAVSGEPGLSTVVPVGRQLVLALARPRAAVPTHSQNATVALSQWGDAPAALAG